MGEALQRRLKQGQFESPAYEALLNVMVAADHLHNRADDVCAKFKLTFGEYNVLRILRGAAQDGHTAESIQSRMVHHSADVPTILEKLDHDRWVDREGPHDNPQLLVARITPRGLRLVEEMEAAVRTLHDHVSSCLTRREIRELSRMCECIYGNDPSCGQDSETE